MASNNINTDVYNIAQIVEDVKKQFIPDESDQTLSVSTYGYLGAVETKKMQRATILAGELSNEAFPSRAKLERNIITHAIVAGIEDINGIPAKMHVLIGIKQSDMEANIKNDKFTIDRECSIFVDNFEFHFEYDIIVTKAVVAGGNIVYTARYDMGRANPSSNITNPYLSSPAIMYVENDAYIFMSCIISQVSHNTVYSKLVTSNIIDNKTLNFEFTDQLAYFEVFVSEGKESVYLTPVFEGSAVPQGVLYYCYYTYIDSQIVRVKFDKNSYMPGLNANIEVRVKTTRGKEGVFEYTDDIFVNLSSSSYGYKNISILLIPQSNSVDGVNRKSKDELQALLPKEIFSRGSITTITDLNNYFNQINTDNDRMVVQKKIDNQIERTYYAYMVLKDTNNDVVPTNTIDIKISLDQFSGEEYNRYILSPGACVKLDESGVGHIIDPIDIKPGDFIYTTPYTVSVNKYHLYSAYYMMIMNMDPILHFSYINQNAKLQFIAQTVHWERKFLTDKDKYIISFTIAQNINQDMGMVVLGKDESGQVIIKENNLKAIAIFYRDDMPYRWKEIELDTYETDTFMYNWIVDLKSSDTLDEENCIRVEDVNILKTENTDFGYFNPNTAVDIYVLAKFKDGEYGRYDLDDLVPNLEGYTLCNKYSVVGGLDFFYNYSEIMGSRVYPIGDKSPTDPKESITTTGYFVSSIPVFGYEYCQEEVFIDSAINALNYRKAYIDNAVTILENSFGIDFKLFNTYGPSRTYTMDHTNRLDRVNISLVFKAKLVSASDSYTLSYIKKDIKDYIEDLNDIGSIHMPNLITQITNDYKELITFFEFVSINGYGPGTQHIYKDTDIGIHVAPEFISVNNILDNTGVLVPDIMILSEQ